jgi:hypothetical protein
VRYRKVPQVSDHSDTEDDEAELLNTGQHLNQVFRDLDSIRMWSSIRIQKVKDDPGKREIHIIIAWGLRCGFLS